MTTHTNDTWPDEQETTIDILKSEIIRLDAELKTVKLEIEKFKDLPSISPSQEDLINRLNDYEHASIPLVKSIAMPWRKLFIRQRNRNWLPLRTHKPKEGKPIIISISGNVNSETWLLDAQDINDYTTEYWLEPVRRSEKVIPERDFHRIQWMPLPEPPEKESSL